MFIEDFQEITNCIVLDTETVTDDITGIPKIWELAIIVIKNANIVEKREWLISPNAKFEKLDIWYEEDIIDVDKIKSSPSFAQLYNEFELYLQPNNIICGHNVDYDLRGINRELSLLQLPLIGEQKIDTMRMSRFLFPEWEHHTLDDVCRKYNLEIEKRHRALDDTYATALAYLKMREAIMQKIKTKNALSSFGLFE